MSKALSSSFKTLRDMTPENTIHSSQLERIQGVGSGTFATGLCYSYQKAALPLYLSGAEDNRIEVFITRRALLQKLW